MHIERVDPLDLDLDTAEEIAAVDRASLDEAGLALPAPVGPSRLTALRLGADGRPVDGLWLAREGEDLAGYGTLQLPVSENTATAEVRGAVHPSLRRRGTGRALWAEALDLARAAGRTTVYAGAWRGTAGGTALRQLGFSADGLVAHAVRRIDVHGAPHGVWDRLYDEASGHGRDYELVHLEGPTPEGLVEEMAVLHAAVNDAPASDPGFEGSVWSSDRVRAYDTAMAGRRQSVHRVLARHRTTGEWAGISILCVDEFNPATAFQEDTSVLRKHRGHRLGLLLKTEMLRWLCRDRPEVAAVDTWNATTNHHMIAVNERLGARVVALHDTYRLLEAT